jgi:hypothetical protein
MHAAGMANYLGIMEQAPQAADLLARPPQRLEYSVRFHAAPAGARVMMGRLEAHKRVP